MQLSAKFSSIRLKVFVSTHLRCVYIYIYIFIHIHTYIVIPQLGNLVKSTTSLEKPLVKVQVTRQISLRSKDKIALEIVNKKLEELENKEPITSSTSRHRRLANLDIHTASSSSNKTSLESKEEIEQLENQFKVYTCEYLCIYVYIYNKYIHICI